MIEDKIIETKYKKLYKYQIKWAKHCASKTAYRAHSSTQVMEDPARKTLGFCLTIENKNTSYIVKTEQIKSFYENCDNKELIKQRFYNSYYKEWSSIKTTQNAKSITMMTNLLFV